MWGRVMLESTRRVEGWGMGCGSGRPA
jgi:hypothetical protein